LAVRNLVAMFSLATLALAGSASAGENKSGQDAKVARAMAVAEIDFELHRAQLGLIGSSLSGKANKPSETPTSPLEKSECGPASAPAEAAAASAADLRK
jgi:hypothetical protein